MRQAQLLMMKAVLDQVLLLFLSLQLDPLSVPLETHACKKGGACRAYG